MSDYSYNTWYSGNYIIGPPYWGFRPQIYVSRTVTNTQVTFTVTGRLYAAYISWSGANLTIADTNDQSKSKTASYFNIDCSNSEGGYADISSSWTYNRGDVDQYVVFSCTVGAPYNGTTAYSTAYVGFDIEKKPYSNCTAPTSITTSTTLTTPNANVILSWSGASGGTSNPVSKYSIYRSTSENDGYSYLGETTSTSYTVQSSSTRGGYYYYKVKSIGSVSGYDSGISTAHSYVKTNSLPGAPSVSVNKNIVSSNGEIVTFTVSPGTDSDTQQVKSLYYSTSSSGTKTVFSSPLNLNISNTTTYYFWTYDGLEYSESYTAKTITKNGKPTISFSNPQNTTYTANGSSSWVKSIAGNFVFNKSSGTLKCTMHYSTSESGTYSTINFLSKTISSVSNSINISVNEILKDIYNNERIYYYITAIFNDGIEDSDELRYPSNTTKYSIASVPTLGNIYNQFSNSDIVGTINGHFYNKIRKYYNRDTEISSCEVSAKYSSSGVSIPCSGTLHRNSGYIDIIFNENINGGQDVLVTLSFSNGIFNKINTFTATQVKDIVFNNPQQAGPNPLKPYTTTGVFNIQSAWPFGILNLENARTEYEFSENSFIRINYNLNNLNLSSIAPIKENNSLKLAVNAETISNIILSNFNSLFGNNASKSGIKNCNYQIGWTNLYNKTFLSSNIPISVSFEENPTFTVTQAQYSINNSDWLNLGSSSYLQELLYVRPTITLNCFTQEALTVTFMYSKDNGDTWNIWSNSNISASGCANRTRESINIVGESKRLGEIQYTYDWKFKVVLSKNNLSSDILIYKAIKHIVPSLSLTNSNYNIDAQIITTSFLINDFGYNSSIETDDSGSGTDPKRINKSSIYTKIDDEAISDELNIESNSTSASSSYPLQNDFLQVKIKITTVIQGYVTTTKIGYSNIFVIYNLSPTVAYRHNQLGINTSSPATNALLDVHMANNEKKYIYITGPSHLSSIDVDSGIIDGFILNCGTWT